MSFCFGMKNVFGDTGYTGYMLVYINYVVKCWFGWVVWDSRATPK